MNSSTNNSNDEEGASENSILRLKQKYINKTREAIMKRSAKHGHELSYHSFASRYANITAGYKRKINDLLLNNSDLAKSLETARLDISRLEEELENAQRQLSFKMTVQSKLTKVSSNLSNIATLIADTVTSIMDAKKLMCSGDALNIDPFFSNDTSSKSSFEMQSAMTCSNSYPPTENTSIKPTNQRDVWKPCRPKIHLDMSAIAEVSVISEDTTRNLTQLLQAAAIAENICSEENSMTPEALNVIAKPSDKTEKLSLENIPIEKQVTPQNKELDTSRETPKTPVLSSNPQFLPSLIPKPIRPFLLRKQRLLDKNKSPSSANELLPLKNCESNSQIISSLNTKAESTKIDAVKQSNHINETNVEISNKGDVNRQELSISEKLNNSKDSSDGSQKHNTFRSLLGSGSSPELFIPAINRKTFFVNNKSPISAKRKTFVISRDSKRLNSICEADTNITIPTKESIKKSLSNKSQQNSIQPSDNLKINDSEDLTQILLQLPQIDNNVVDVPKAKRETITLSHPIDRVDEFVELDHSDSDTPIVSMQNGDNLKSDECSLDGLNIKNSSPHILKTKKDSLNATILNTVDMELTEALPSGLVNSQLLGLTPGNNLVPSVTNSNTNGEVALQTYPETVFPVLQEVDEEQGIKSAAEFPDVENDDSFHLLVDDNNDEVAATNVVTKVSSLEKRTRRKSRKNYKLLLGSPDKKEKDVSPREGTKKLKSKNSKKILEKKPKPQVSTKSGNQAKNKNSSKNQLFTENENNPTIPTKKNSYDSRKRKSNIYDVFDEEVHDISPYKSKKMEQILKNEDNLNVSHDLFDNAEEHVKLPDEAVKSLKTDIQVDSESLHVISASEKKKSCKNTSVRKKKNIAKTKIEGIGKENEQSFTDFCLEPPKNTVFVKEPKKRVRQKNPLKSHNVDTGKRKAKNSVNYQESTPICSPVIRLENLLLPVKQSLGADCQDNSFEIRNENILKITSPTGQSLELVLPQMSGKLSTNSSIKTPKSRQGSICHRKGSISIGKNSTISPSTSESGRSRRHKLVSYKEPSLHIKLRR